MKRVVQIAVPLLVSCLVFFFLDYILYFDSQTSLAVLFSTVGVDPYSGSIIPLLILALVSAVVFAALLQVSFNRINTSFFAVCFAVYFAALLTVLFLKSQGIQEVNLNLEDVVQQAIFYPSSVLLNVILFIPLGAWLFTWQKSNTKAFFIALGFCVAVEAIQYVFSLGIADIVDIFLNMIGFAVGYLFCDLCSEFGLILLPYEKATWKHFSCERGGAAARHANDGLFYRKRVIPLLGLLVAVFVLVCLGSTHFEYQEFQKEKLDFDTVEVANNETLLKLPKSNQSVDLSKRALAAMRTAKVEGSETNNKWLDLNADGSFSVEGYVTDYYQWLDESGNTQTGITVAVSEVCDGLNIVHGVPVVLRDSAVELQGEVLDLSSTEGLGRFEELYQEGVASCKFLIQEGWLESVSFSVRKGKEPAGYIMDSYTDWSSYSACSGKASANNDYWLEMEKGASFSLTGKLMSVTEIEGKTSYVQVAVLDQLGSVSITHQVKVLYKGDTPEADQDTGLITMEVSYAAGNLQRAD